MGVSKLKQGSEILVSSCLLTKQNIDTPDPKQVQNQSQTHGNKSK